MHKLDVKKYKPGSVPVFYSRRPADIGTPSDDELFLLRPVKNVDSANKCSWCWNLISEEVAKLGEPYGFVCGHYFHRVCTDQMLEDQNKIRLEENQKEDSYGSSFESYHCPDCMMRFPQVIRLDTTSPLDDESVFDSDADSSVLEDSDRPARVHRHRVRRQKRRVRAYLREFRTMREAYILGGLKNIVFIAGRRPAEFGTEEDDDCFQLRPTPISELPDPSVLCPECEFSVTGHTEGLDLGKPWQLPCGDHFHWDCVDEMLQLQKKDGKKKGKETEEYECPKCGRLFAKVKNLDLPTLGMDPNDESVFDSGRESSELSEEENYVPSSSDDDSKSGNTKSTGKIQTELEKLKAQLDLAYKAADTYYDEEVAHADEDSPAHAAKELIWILLKKKASALKEKFEQLELLKKAVATGGKLQLTLRQRRQRRFKKRQETRDSVYSTWMKIFLKDRASALAGTDEVDMPLIYRTRFQNDDELDEEYLLIRPIHVGDDAPVLVTEICKCCGVSLFISGSEGDDAKKLPCGHRFHHGCIDLVYKNSGTKDSKLLLCPTCNAPYTNVQRVPDASREEQAFASDVASSDVGERFDVDALENRLKKGMEKYDPDPEKGMRLKFLRIHSSRQRFPGGRGEAGNSRISRNNL